MKKIAVILSGCGVFDGSEIHEATMLLLAIKKNNCNYEIFAPNVMQHHVINHITGEVMNEQRNVLIESARIARGKINDLTNYNPKNFDALILPGGFGAAKNLSTYAFKGDQLTVLPIIEKAIIDTHTLNRPIGAMCVAPIILAKVLKQKTNITLGDDKEAAKTVEKLGHLHTNTTKGSINVDKNNKIVTAPCYMLDSDIYILSQEADKLVQSIIELI